MFAFDVDVSNGKNTVAVLCARRIVVMMPFEVSHTAEGFASLAEKLNGLDGKARIVMEHIDWYYEPFAMSMYRAGFFVSTVNPLAIKDYREDVSVRKLMTDKADAVRMTVGMTKFLRTYYGKVRDHLMKKSLWETLPSQKVNPD